jgi:hypothetical protein
MKSTTEVKKGDLVPYVLTISLLFVYLIGLGTIYS